MLKSAFIRLVRYINAPIYDGRCFLVVPTIIKAKKDEPAASVIRRFKKQVIQDGILKDIKKKEYFIKPSQVRKERKKEWEREKRRNRRLNA